MNFPIVFIVPGHPVPFIAQWNKTSRERRKAFADYCHDVRTAAMVGGVRDLVATKENPLHIHTRCVFNRNTHPDPENVHKVIVDALMYDPTGKRKSSARDKYTGGAFTPPQYGERPFVEVIIADGHLPLIETLPRDW